MAEPIADPKARPLADMLSTKKNCWRLELAEIKIRELYTAEEHQQSDQISITFECFIEPLLLRIL
jgi:hypothetical protein